MSVACRGCKMRQLDVDEQSMNKQDAQIKGEQVASSRDASKTKCLLACDSTGDKQDKAGIKECLLQL